MKSHHPPQSARDSRSEPRKVYAVGLDAVGFDLIEKFAASGAMPTVKGLLAEGSFAPLATPIRYQGGDAAYASTEGNWVMFQTGVRPTTSGYWETIRYDRHTYRTTNDFSRGGYDYQQYPPFYALGEDFRTVTFDLPVSKVVPEVNGTQIVGWGGHFPYVVRGSQPASLLKDLNRRHGKNGVLYRDHGVFWSRKYRRWVKEASIQAMAQRAAIAEELIAAHDPQLYVGVLGETHSVLHDLWAASDTNHPVHFACQESTDPLREVFSAVDATIGRLAERARQNTAALALFSVHGMQANSTDLPCTFLLAEMMYRFNFPGRYGFAKGEFGAPCPPPVTSGLHWYWFGEIWRRRHAGSKLLDQLFAPLPAWARWQWPWSHFRFPFLMNPTGPENGWLPTLWYKPAWPQSRSFALPAFADGHVRINLAGRESCGQVTPGQYAAECDRVTKFLLGIINPRTGAPVVQEVIRTRKDPLDNDPRLPEADLVVVWTEEPFDMAESPEMGRIDPVPYFRTGGHKPGGFALLAGQGIAAGATLPQGEITDLAPTLLELAGAPIPAHFEGRSLLSPDRQARQVA